MLAAMGSLGMATPSNVASVPFRTPSASDFSLTGRAAGRVLVLGGGVTGLACAYELTKAGYDCTVLEAQHRIGGRNLTVRNGTAHTDLDGHTQTATYQGGQYLNAGPARIAQWMLTLDYCRELGVPLEVFTNVNAEAYIYRERHGMTPGHPVRRREAQSDVNGYVAELLAKATDQGALNQLLSAEDREKLLDLCRHFGHIGKRVVGDPDRSWSYHGGSQRGYPSWPGATGTPGTESGPVPTLSQVLASEVGRDLGFELSYKQEPVMLQPVGGMDAIPAALAKAVGEHRIRLGCAVLEITDHPDRVSVTYRDSSARQQRIDTDFVIATLPPNLLARIPHNLGSGVQQALRTFTQEPAGKIGLEYRSRWWESNDRIYGGISETDLDLSHLWYPSHDYHAERGVLVGYYNTGHKATRYDTMTPAEREARAIHQGMKIHGPVYRDELASSFSISWSRAPYIEGGWQKIPGGPEAPAYAPLNAPAGRVYFAGDWLSHLVSWQHGAFTSARKAVTALHTRSLAV